MIVEKGFELSDIQAETTKIISPSKSTTPNFILSPAAGFVQRTIPKIRDVLLPAWCPSHFIFCFAVKKERKVLFYPVSGIIL